MSDGDEFHNTLVISNLLSNEPCKLVLRTSNFVHQTIVVKIVAFLPPQYFRQK